MCKVNSISGCNEINPSNTYNKSREEKIAEINQRIRDKQRKRKQMINVIDIYNSDCEYGEIEGGNFDERR